MTTVTQPEKNIEQVKAYFGSPREALTHTVGNAALLVQEARVAAQQLDRELAEPILRLIGWVEGSTFHQLTSDPQIKQQMLGNGSKQ